MASARGIPESEVKVLVYQHIEPAQFGIMGQERVNVLNAQPGSGRAERGGSDDGEGLPTESGCAAAEGCSMREQEAKQGRGMLKIILGSAAGVGKTYHMLEEAQSLKKDCVDVVVAVVETHGRPETEALLEGLEVIPRRRVEHGGCHPGRAGPGRGPGSAIRLSLWWTSWLIPMLRAHAMTRGTRMSKSCWRRGSMFTRP